jgi:5-methylcytosine-specific restriction endonuclease McrBC GTP-binding regulatory subunit McrB
LPTNLVVTGTVNLDETTYGFSPKVLDRAMVIEFDLVDLDDLRSATERRWRSGAC